MKLSIVMVFCDKDYQYVEKSLINLRKNIYLDYEVILMDNREWFKKNTLNLNDKGNVIYIDNKENVYQYQARKDAVNYCNGDYIWYIDPDDRILRIDENILDNVKEADIYSFKHIRDDLKIVENTHSEEYYVKTYDYEKDKECFKINNINSGLWAYWIKKSVLEKAIMLIPDAKLYYMEDLMITRSCYVAADSISFVDKIIYCFNKDLSRSCKKKKNIKDFLMLFYGSWKLKEINNFIVFYIYSIYDNANLEELIEDSKTIDKVLSAELINDLSYIDISSEEYFKKTCEYIYKLKDFITSLDKKDLYLLFDKYINKPEGFNYDIISYIIMLWRQDKIFNYYFLNNTVTTDLFKDYVDSNIKKIENSNIEKAANGKFDLFSVSSYKDWMVIDYED